MASKKSKSKSGRKAARPKARAKGSKKSLVRLRIEKKIRALKQHLAKNKEDLQSRYLLSKFEGMLKLKNA